MDPTRRRGSPRTVVRFLLLLALLAVTGAGSAQDARGPADDLVLRFTLSVAERLSLVEDACPTIVLEMTLDEAGLTAHCFEHDFANFAALAAAWDDSARWDGVFADDPEIRGWLDLTGDGSVRLRIFVFDSAQYGLDERRYLVWASERDNRLFVLYPE